MENSVGWNRSHLRRWKKLLENELEYREKLIKRWEIYPYSKIYHFVELYYLEKLRISEEHIISYQKIILQIESILGPSFPIRIWEWVCSGIGVIDKELVWHEIY